ncbi:hypothetical protein BSL78_11401 [Apostichopus japonicus]|uniref:HYR domain-containing protein n=1 Tax=Stichopus japonicus TaxID=307972 RepID=A0A2G8KUN8_STIJA|nr:hypothetical protein BSL78_11401 [Apostichopus japonicus]
MDTNPPIIINCPEDIFVVAEGPLTSVSWTPPIAFDTESRSIEVSVPASPSGDYPPGVFQIDYIYRDEAFNEAVCSFNITVTGPADTNPPIIINCPEDIFVVAEGPLTSVSWTPPIAFDTESRSIEVSVPPSPSGDYPPGVFQIDYIYRDEAFNEAVCSFNITVAGPVDLNPPIILGCPEDIMVVAEGPLTFVSWTPPLAFDFEGLIFEVSVPLNSSDSYPLGVFQIDYIYRDEAFNEAGCSFNITVTGPVDLNPPILLGCPEDIMVVAEGPLTFVSWTPPTAFDFEGPTFGVSVPLTPFDLYPPGVFQIDYIYRDEASNEAGCSFNITVTEGPVSIVAAPPSSFGLYEVGTREIEYIYADAAGNEAICAFNITITAFDVRPPVISDCPSDMVVVAASMLGDQAFLIWTLPTAEDESGGGVRLVADRYHYRSL